MRITVRIDKHLVDAAERIAAASGQTLPLFVEQALSESLARRRVVSRSPRIRLKTFQGNGVHPRVDLDNSATLLDLMGK